MIESADINLPDVVAEVSTAFQRYEHALVTNDIATLDALRTRSFTVQTPRCKDARVKPGCV